MVGELIGRSVSVTLVREGRATQVELVPVELEL
jgi:hypothetical protein